jgi:hypothetical protein
MTVLPRIKNFINGQWRATETQFQPQNPATHEAIAAGIASEIVMASPDARSKSSTCQSAGPPAAPNGVANSSNLERTP